MRFTSILCLACLGNPDGCQHMDNKPWIPSESDLAFEPHLISSEKQSQDAKPEAISQWEDEGGNSGLRASDNPSRIRQSKD